MKVAGHSDVLGSVGKETVVFRALATLLPHPAATLLVWFMDLPIRKKVLRQKRVHIHVISYKLVRRINAQLLGKLAI